MKTLLNTFVISVMTATLACAGCSTEDAPAADDPTGGLVDGLTPLELAAYRGELVGECAYAIEAMLLADCPVLGVTLDRENATRRAFCTEQTHGIPDECIIEASAYYSCISGDEYRCTWTGPEHLGCKDETQAFRQCIIEAP